MIVINDYRLKLSEQAVLQILNTNFAKDEGAKFHPWVPKIYYTPNSWADLFFFFFFASCKLDC